MKAGDERAAIDETILLCGGDTAGSSSALLDQVTDMLVACLHEVGERWYRSEWTVADEHVATGVAERVLARTISDPEPGGMGRMALVGCAEGEWHSLPARMVAESLRQEGWRVVFLGPSTPSDHLRAFVRSRTPDLIVLSCMFAANLTGLARSIAAVRDAAAPVVVGGRGVHSAETASRIGADGWAARPADLLELLAERGGFRSDGRPEIVSHEVPAIDGCRAELARAGLGAAIRHGRSSATLDPWQVSTLHETAGHLVSCVAAAMLAADDGPLLDFVRWARGLAAFQGDGQERLAPMIDGVRAACGSDLPQSARLLAAGLDEALS